MKLIIGLGNPGKKYQHSRHNVGWITLDYIYDEWLKSQGFSNWQMNKKFQAEVAEGQLNNEKIILAKPQTFMNESGRAVQAMLSFFKLQPQNLIVIHDDIDLTFGKLKVQQNVSSAGHNGIKSIIEKISSQDFTRIRIGIGKVNKQRQGETGEFVLNNFSFFEKLKLTEIKKSVLAEVKKLF